MRLALREIRRAKVRFAILTVAVGLLAFLILFQNVLVESLVTDFIGALRNQDAEVLVLGEDARRNVEGSAVGSQTVAEVAEVPGVARAAAVGAGTFTVRAGDELTDAFLWAYDLDGPGAPTTLVEGRLPERPGEAVSNQGDAADGFGTGDTVRVEPDGPALEIVGVGTQLRYSVTPTLFTDSRTYDEARRAVNPDAAAVVPTLVAVDPEPDADPDELAARIDASVPGVEALTRARAVDESPGVAAVRQSLGLVLALGFVVVIVVTGFFFLILTAQKSAALTLLRAVGASAGFLVRALLAQAVLVVGAGLALATALLIVFARTSTGDLEVSVDAGTIVRNGVALLVCALLAVSVAAVRVLRIEPVRATTGGGAP